MEETIPIGRIAGIRVGANWSLLVVFFLVAWGLANGLASDYPGHADGTYWVVGVIAALVFYGALLAHELGHAVIARRQGVPVEGITLWLFGGVTRMRGEASSPRGALHLALVGPLVSLGAAALFGVLALAFDLFRAPALIEGTTRWLARINLVLAVFNLVPAAPLDGGRVLQAVLWRRRGDRLAASVTAARAGRAFGYVLMGLGALDIVAGVGTGGLWFVLLGWFLVSAARAEQAGAQTRTLLQDVRVADVMTPQAVVVPGWITVDAFVEDYVRRHRARVFPVESFDGTLVGVLTLDALKQVPPHRRASVRVVDVAVPAEDVLTAHPDEMVLDLLERVGPAAGGRALVVDDARVVGIVSPGDVARALEVGAALAGGDHRPARRSEWTSR